MAAANQGYPPGENRILDLLLYYIELESQHRVNNLAARIDSPAALALHEKFLVNALQAYKKNNGLSKNEKSTRRYMQHVLRKVRALQKPTILKRIVYNDWINRQLNRFLGRQGSYDNHEQWVNLYQKKTALTVNTGNLQEEIRQLGFRGQLEEPLRKMMAGNLQEFAIPHYDIHRPDTDYVFHVKRMPGTDAYFLETLVATHRQTKQEILRGELPSPPVVINLKNGKIFNADEARILASGKGLAKDPLKSNEWYVTGSLSGDTKIVQYDLVTELNRFPIQQMAEEPSRSKFLQAIANGEEVKMSLPSPGEGNKEMLVQLDWKEKRNPQLRFKSETGEALDAKELQKTVDLEKIESFSTRKTFDKEESLGTNDAFQKIAAMHEQFAASKEGSLSPAQEAAAEVHARIQSSKENTGAFVLRPTRY